MSRFFSAAKQLDSYWRRRAAGVPRSRNSSRPVGDALTHVGQIVLLRREAGNPVRAESYFMAEITRAG